MWKQLGLTEKQYREVQYQARLELARKDFWEFCKLLAPDFYMEGRDYLKEFCYALQEFYETDERVLIINMPPRHGKSRTAGLFAQWIFGRNPAEKIITGSYNEQLSTTFSRGVRNAINERKTSKEKIVYSDIFPRTYLKKGNPFRLNHPSFSEQTTTKNAVTLWVNIWRFARKALPLYTSFLRPFEESRLNHKSYGNQDTQTTAHWYSDVL